jgi:hypothetical protein
MPSDPASGTVTGKILSYSLAPYGLVFRGYGSGTHSIQTQRESNNAELFPLSLQPLGGNVGIGTTSPAYKLDVVGKIFSNTEIQASSAVINSSGGYASFGSNSGATPIRIGRDTTSNDIIINASGNVGIGNTAPSQVLHVTGNIRVTGAYYDSANSAGTSGQILSSTATGTSWIAAPSGGGISGSGTTNYVPKFTGASAIGNSQIFDNGTNVGIGTTTPSAKLQVLKGSSGNVASFASGATGTGNYSGITLHSSTSAGDDWYGSEIRSINTNGNPSFLNPRLGFFTQDYSTYLPAGRTEKMSILGNGDIGIGTTSPSAKLHVIGNVTVSATLLTANAKLTGTLTDSLNQVGTAGQVLSSTGTGTEWITGGGGGGGSTIIVKDEGTTIGSSFTTLNFVGDNIQATASGSTAVVTAYNNAGTGSLYANDTTVQYPPTASFADVEINATTVLAAAPDTAGTSQKLIAIVTFGVENVSTYDGFNNFQFRLYNSSGTSAVPDTTHSWCSYMSKNEFETRTVFTFHIPLFDGVGASETITVQAKQSTAYTPEIYYCALTFIEGTN